MAAVVEDAQRQDLQVRRHYRLDSEMVDYFMIIMVVPLR